MLLIAVCCCWSRFCSVTSIILMNKGKQLVRKYSLKSPSLSLDDCSEAAKKSICWNSQSDNYLWHISQSVNYLWHIFHHHHHNNAPPPPPYTTSVSPPPYITITPSMLVKAHGPLVTNLTPVNMASRFKIRCSLTGHKKDVRAVAPAYFPDGGIISGSRDVTSRVWVPNECVYYLISIRINFCWFIECYLDVLSPSCCVVLWWIRSRPETKNCKDDLPSCCPMITVFKMVTLIPWSSSEFRHNCHSEQVCVWICLR